MATFASNQLQIQLLEAGNRLLFPPAVPELLDLLGKVEQLLSKVGQMPSKGMQESLKPSIEAVIANELVRHPDLNVKVSVASCISEILRITAPEAPYDDEQLKEFFQLAVTSFEKLSSNSGSYYSKITSILRTFSQYKLSVVMLDLHLDELVVKMFQIFFMTASSNQSNTVLVAMEKIMTLIVEESEEVAPELMSLLVSTLKKENMNASPHPWRLGEKVLRNCAAKLKSQLSEFLSSKGLDLCDFVETVALVCRDDSGNEILEANQLAPGAISLGEFNPAEDDALKSAMLDAVHMRTSETSEAGNTLKMAMPCQHAAEHASDDQRKSPADFINPSPAVYDAVDFESTTTRAEIKPDSQTGNPEGIGKVFFAHALKYQQKKTPALSDHLETSGSPLSAGKAALSCVLSLPAICKGTSSLGSLNQSFVDGTRRRRQWSNTKETTTDHDSSLGQLSYSVRDSSGARVCDLASPQAPFALGNSDIVEDSKGRPGRDAGSTNKFWLCRDLKGKSGLSVETKKRSSDTGKTTSTVHFTENSEACEDNIQQNGISKEKRKRNCTLMKEEACKQAHPVLEYGENLVGSRIKVWWPLDKMFYEGVIASFDYSTKRHKVCYTDGDEELLHLKFERWEFVSDVGGQGQWDTPVANTSATATNGLHDSFVPSRENQATSVDGADLIPSSSKKSRKLVVNKAKSEGDLSIDPLAITSTSKTHENCPEFIQVGSCSEAKVEKPLTLRLPIKASPIKATPKPKKQVAKASRGMVNVQGYTVKATSAPILEVILSKHGDIAAPCLYNSASVKASFLEIICEVVRRLQSNDAAAIISELEAIENEILDVEKAKIEVSWLRAHLERLHRTKEASQKSRLLMGAKANTILVARAARKDLEQRRVELLAAQERFQEAQRTVRALEVVQQKIHFDILEHKAEESFLRRQLDGGFL